MKDKESFAYKLRKLRAQLFEENGNGSMSSSSVEKYQKMVKKFITKFKNYKMHKGVRLLNYEVDLWKKKISDTKEALASDVKEVKNMDEDNQNIPKCLLFKNSSLSSNNRT